MNINTHISNDLKIAEVVSQEILINDVDDALDLLASLYHQGYDKILVYERNITPDFFDLKTRIAGEILQKFSNYRMQLGIIGDFSKYTSKSINDFIYESNKNRHIVFVDSVSSGIELLNR